MRRTAVLTTLCHNSSSVIVCPKQQCTAHSRRFILDVLRAGLFLSICYCVSAPESLQCLLQELPFKALASSQISDLRAAIKGSRR